MLQENFLSNHNSWFFSSHSVILEKNREKNQSESPSSSSSRCDREMVLYVGLIFPDFSEVLSDNLTTDFLAFWPNSYSGKILLWPSWTAAEGFEVDSTDGGFLKVDGFLNETAFLSSELSAGFSSRLL